MVTSSRPLKRIEPPTMRPLRPRSRITPRATVDLPQPDSPTRPSAWPGSTVAEKFITAGISPARVKKEIDRSSMTRRGSAMGAGPRLAAAADRHRSILHRLLAQRVGEQVEAEHQAHDRE